MSKAKPDVARAQSLALSVVYYFCSFMPLHRGSAMCGLLALHGMLLATGYKVGWWARPRSPCLPMDVASFGSLLSCAESVALRNKDFYFLVFACF